MTTDIGIFFGSDTGNTEKIAMRIQTCLGKNISTIYDIADSKQEDIEQYNTIILGVSTWYYGELQCDWDDFLPIFKKINFYNKTIAFFGCGDQEDYSEYFCDGMGILFNNIKKTHVNFIGKWSTNDYFFDDSKALHNNQYFLGLAIDEDRQPKKSEKRVIEWTQQLKEELQMT
ncbi:MAG: flavodoxin FldA [Buchnera aphidicola (Kaburagia rhusicola rhusicola)]